MMDVISARRESDDTEYQLNAIQQRIETILHTPVSASYTDSLPPPTDPWGLIRNDLFLIERNILIGDWGGYRQEYRRPFLERVDRLRTMMGETPPIRPEHVYTQTQRQYQSCPCRYSTTSPTQLKKNTHKKHVLYVL